MRLQAMQVRKNQSMLSVCLRGKPAQLTVIDDIRPLCGSCTKYNLLREYMTIAERERPCSKSRERILRPVCQRPFLCIAAIIMPSDRFLEPSLTRHFILICDERLHRTMATSPEPSCIKSQHGRRLDSGHWLES